MTLLTNTVVVGVACSLRTCKREERLAEPIGYHTRARDSFEQTLLASGWAMRVGRSVGWYCPAHAERAGRCAGGRYGCSRHCPVHHGGTVVTAATR